MFSEEDLTRFFQILLHTDDDLRRKPDARLHLEMGLLRMVNAARLAPLEEILAELEGGSSRRQFFSAADAIRQALRRNPSSPRAAARQRASPAGLRRSLLPLHQQRRRRRGRCKNAGGYAARGCARNGECGAGKNERGPRPRRSAERDCAGRRCRRRPRSSASGLHQGRDSGAGKISR